MSINEAEFPIVLAKIRDGDADAARELVIAFEPEIRREIRIRMTDPRLRRIVDSIDICQSVQANFFVRYSSGQFDLAHPNQLFRLLTTMAKRKIVDRYRMENTRRMAIESVEQEALNRTNPLNHLDSNPTNAAEQRELLQNTLRSMTDEESRIAELRRAGKSWKQVAELVGSTDQAARKTVSRACLRILKQLHE